MENKRHWPTFNGLVENPQPQKEYSFGECMPSLEEPAEGGPAPALQPEFNANDSVQEHSTQDDVPSDFAAKELALKKMLSMVQPLNIVVASPCTNQESRAEAKRKDWEDIVNELAEYVLSKVHLLRCGRRVFLFDGRSYQPINHEIYKDLIWTVLSDKLGNPELYGKQEKALFEVETLIFHKNMPAIHVGKEREDEEIISLPNGILNFATYTFKSINPKEIDPNSCFVTRQLEVPWRKGSSFDCFISSFALTYEEHLQMYKMMAYLLFAPDNRAHRFFVLMGNDQREIQLFCKVLEAILPSKELGFANIFKLGKGYSVPELYNKQVNICKYPECESLSPEVVTHIKDIVDHNVVDIEYEHDFCQRIRCKLLFIAKDTQSVREQLQREFGKRAVILSFRGTQEKELSELPQKIIGELPGIVYLAVVAYCVLKKHGFEFLQ